MEELFTISKSTRNLRAWVKGLYMGYSLSYFDLLLPQDITPKKETLGRKKHNREDRTEVIIVSDDETESVVKGSYLRKLL